MRSAILVAAAGVLAQTALASKVHNFRINAGLISPHEKAVRQDDGSDGCSGVGSYNEECGCCGCTCTTWDYLEDMCYPDYYDAYYDEDYGYYLYPDDVTAPCEQFTNLYVECAANGTDEIDYIAQQECICNGGFFQYFSGCMTCEEDHGAYIGPDYDYLLYDYIPTASISALSSSYCAAPTPDDFDAYILDVYDTIESEVQVATSTSGTDLYPNSTAVSLYFTLTGSKTGLGAITGSATAATLSYNTDFGGSDGFPTPTSPSGGVTAGLAPGQSSVTATGTASTTVSASGSASGSSTTSAATTSASTGAATQVKVAGGLLAAGALGVAILL